MLFVQINAPSLTTGYILKDFAIQSEFNFLQISAPQPRYNQSVSMFWLVYTVVHFVLALICHTQLTEMTQVKEYTSMSNVYQNIHPC